MSTRHTSPTQSGGSATHPGSSTEDDLPAEGSHIGRYIVLNLLGRGGMGVVLRAFDPKLDRKIALKLLHGGSSGEAQLRLQREAQALARCSHPNVIRVHDVGTHEGRVFIAMELVSGGTLGDWLRREPRPWPEALGVFIDAGEGLATAHAAGLVHRDFKPANVLMSEDGRVKVTDFGLARAHADLPATGSEPLTESLPELDPASQEATLTRTGALVGTPAYMPPEQLDGRTADPRSDQFSFCVALYEALAGRRPFEGKTLGRIALAILRQEFSVPLPARVPRPVGRAIRRGLRYDPATRHPDMPSLLRALRWGLSVRRRQATWVVAAAMVGGGSWWAMQGEPVRGSEYCEQVGQRLDGVWDDTRRAEAKEAFLATRLSYAADTWALTRARLDAQAGQWVAAQRSACEAEAALTAGSAPEGDPRAQRETIDRQMVCLHRRRAELQQLGALLRTADAVLVERAPRAVEALGEIESCARTLGGPSGVEGPAALAMAEALGEVKVLQEAGRYDEAVAAAEAAHASMQQAPRALQAELRLAVAQALDDAGRAEDAEHEFHRAFSAAVASGHDEAALRAALGLAAAQVSHGGKPRFDEAERWTEHATAALDRLNGGSELHGRIENVRGQIDYQRGDFEAARGHFEAALHIREQDLGPDNYRMANYHNNLGQVLSALERTAEAIEHQRRSLELERAHYGEGHPRVASAMTSLCSSYSNSGQLEAAIRIGTEAVTLLRNTVGDDHPKLGTALINLGSAQARAGDAAGAEVTFLAALDNSKAAYGEDNRRVGLVLNNLGVHYEMTGRLADAERYHQQASEVFAKALGPDHPTTAIVTSNLASVMVKQGKHDEAERVVRGTLTTLEARLGPDHPDVALPLGVLAEALVGREQLDQALPLLERVLVLRQPGRAPPGEIADTRYALGDVLWRAGRARDRPRAIELVRQAYESYAAQGEAQQERRERARSWLVERGVMEE